MALTDTAIRNAKSKDKPYKVSDSGGLYLLVNPIGSKLWRVKYRMHGVERKLSLGPILPFRWPKRARQGMMRRGNLPMRSIPVRPSGKRGSLRASAPATASPPLPRS